MFRLDDPRSQPRVLQELTLNKMAEEVDSDIAIRFVDENDYREISAGLIFILLLVFYYSTKITRGVL